MKMTKRVGLYIVRHQLKCGILFLICSLMATFVLVGISTEQTVRQTANQIRTNLGGEITLSDGGSTGHLELDEMVKHILDGSINDITDETGNPNRLRRETLNAILEIPGVVDYNLMTRDALIGSPKNLNFIAADFGFNLGLENDEDMFSVYGVSNSERFEGFANGNLNLEMGRHLGTDDQNAVLISQELARLNNIKIGDTIELSGTSTGGNLFITMIENISAQPRVNMSLEVVGIFSGTEGIGGFMQGNLPSNQLIVDIASFYDPSSSDILPPFLSIFVNDPRDIISIYEEIMNLPEVYGKNFITAMGIEGFEAISSPLEALQLVVLTMILLMIVVAVVILTILLTIWARDRKKEIGIFLSIGITKAEIIKQFILESLLIAVVAFVVAIPVSQQVVGSTGNFILSQFQNSHELQSETEMPTSELGATLIQMDGLRGAAPTLERTLNDINFEVTIHHFITTSFIGLSVVISSVILASYSVIKLKPKEILSTMS